MVATRSRKPRRRARLWKNQRIRVRFDHVSLNTTVGKVGDLFASTNQRKAVQAVLRDITESLIKGESCTGAGSNAQGFTVQVDLL